MATLQMGDTTFEKGDTETEKAPYFRGFGGYPELFKSCFPHQRIAQSAIPQTVDKARFNKGKRAISMSRREKYEATRPRAS